MGDIRNERHRTANHVEIYAAGDDGRILVATGTRAKVTTATNADFSVETGAQYVRVAGDAEPQETVDGGHSYSVRVGRVVLRTEKTPNPGQLVNGAELDIECYDKYGGTLVAAARGCKLASASTAFQANQIVAKNLSFIATGVQF